MALPDPPPAWGHDELTKLFDLARANEYATFANYKSEIGRLLDIDRAYRKGIDGLNHSKDWFAGFFLLRAHSNLVAACRLAWAGQIPECYAILRSCLENALYGVYLAQNPKSRETWLRRHESDEAMRAVKDEFKIRSMLDLAQRLDKPEADVAHHLYERTIDYGAHPNERALLQTLQINESDDHIQFKIVYLEGDSDQLKLSLKTTSQVGVCGLALFRSVYRERFNILDLTNMLDHIKKGL